MMKERNNRAGHPGMLLRIASRIIKDDDRDFAEGDLIELYTDEMERNGERAARKLVLTETLLSVPGFLRSNAAWRMSLAGNYLKTAARKMMRQKAFTLINVGSLAIGLTGCILILLWTGYVGSFDSYLPGADAIHQVLISGTVRDNPYTPAPLAPILAEEYPEIISFTRYMGNSEMLVEGPGGSFYEGYIYAVDPSFFEVFPFDFVYGVPDGALDSPDGIVLTRSLASKYFPGTDPVGRSLTLDKDLEMVVTGVVEDVPGNSTIRFRMLLPIEKRFAIDSSRGRENGWETFNTATYLRLGEGMTAGDLTPKLSGFFQRHHEAEDDLEISLLPLAGRLAFFTPIRQYSRLMMLIAAFVLVIACLNFTNLSTARSSGRGLEIGVRKVSGAGRSGIISQFLGESLLFALVALAVSVLLAATLLPTFSRLSGFELEAGMMLSRGMIAGMLGLTILAGLCAGIYPAFFLSSFEPVKVLKGVVKGGGGRSRLRSSMVVFQFVLASLMITSTMAIFRQHELVRDSETGIDREGIVNVQLRGGTSDKYDVLKQRLLSEPGVIGVSGSLAGMPFFSWRTGSARWEGMDTSQEHMVYFNGIDEDFLEVFGIELVEGRGFSGDFPGDVEQNLLVNESMARLMGGGNVTGRAVEYWDRKAQVVGVVRDFNFQPMDADLAPAMFILTPDRISFMSVRLDPDDTGVALERLREVWEEIVPGYPLEYRFIDEIYGEQYAGIARTRDIFAGFSILAISVACMGLLGLASFIARSRSKEIGIRKVLGAGDLRILALVTKDLVLCVVLANVVAVPIAWLGIRVWLEDYVRRIDPGAGFYLFPLAFTLAVALLTVSWQMVGAVRRNPVDSLRYE